MASQAHTTRRALLSAAPALPLLFASAPALPAAVNPIAAAGAWIKEYRANGGGFAILDGDVYFGSRFPPAPAIKPLQGQIEGRLGYYVEALVREAHMRGAF